MASRVYRGEEGGTEQDSYSEMSDPKPSAPEGYEADDATIIRADNGGFIVRCHYRPSQEKGEAKSDDSQIKIAMSMRPKEYAVSTFDEAVNVQRKHFGL